MRRTPGPLLCELHAHTTWSDGELAVPELVDVYGRHGFDVLCVTDHVVRSDDPWLRQGASVSAIDESCFPTYLAEVEYEALRARKTYGMVVIPGIELTYNDEVADEAAHAVAIGLRDFVPVDDGIDRAMRIAASAGAALVAAHPNATEPATAPGRLTKRFAVDSGLRMLAHRFELFNRTQLFGWVAEAGLPGVASGDFHEREHLWGWKTMLPSAHEERAIVEYLRSRRPVYLVRLDPERARLAA